MKTLVSDLFSDAIHNKTYVKFCAPMVRYSKVQFRTLVRNFNVDLCFTPMILADSFCQNEKARISEFATTANDTPLIVQFAANSVDDFVDASKLIYNYADGVDLNCGCPQKWAIKDGYGCSLLSRPEMIQNFVRGVRSSLPNSFSVSVKIRLLKDLKKTIEICRQLEKCGVNFLTVHGRTPDQKSSGNVNTDALRAICGSVNIPVIANGGVKTLADADELHSAVNCSGVMAAGGILTNPALFSGINKTPRSCVKLWKNMKDLNSDKITFQCYHHHLVFMLEKVLLKQEKQVFNRLGTFELVDEFLGEYFSDTLDSNKYPYNLGSFTECDFASEITMKHSVKCRSCCKSKCYCICNEYNSNKSDGAFYTSFVKDLSDIDYIMDSNLFQESV